ncbi:hypothetical protein [Streptococcus marmotae]|uniref:hypothetical protein n=1 Tax=Streptococcus marmotae TaxID=1825069 RepID=UPI00082C38D7|nr:hypothetical protein [Streptococcus marmotae]
MQSYGKIIGSLVLAIVLLGVCSQKEEVTPDKRSEINSNDTSTTTSSGQVRKISEVDTKASAIQTFWDQGKYVQLVHFIEEWSQ